MLCVSKTSYKSPFAKSTGFVWEIARRFGALDFYAEECKYIVVNLTAEQALADYAELITELKRSQSAKGCPAVLFCGSYDRMWVAWMRLKYRHIAIGALAASPPILQFEDIVPPETFSDLVSNGFYAGLYCDGYADA
ncbi:hypothetical protein FEM48_Zijuj08G0134600 [Ziziphus jujuba var. spinosa]|uniref:Uncharacterized protein n=1 Tax=Ziziphus jujuba var. spinosa TaxID=714518 RepID=A0A978UZD3_ZIZJJ|nr:hypothetical protein FEM48_Zijuj08G0134600 [Ziziphus jujuba var. spinosa]